MSRNPDYFKRVQQALLTVGCAQPAIVIDKSRLDSNLATLTTSAPAHMRIRIVAKSLPSPELLRYVTDRVDTNRLMTFNLPTLTSLIKAMPDCEHLLGKPFPVRAAAHFYEDWAAERSDPRSEPAIHWLIDSEDRLAQYDQLASKLRRVLAVSIELDIGLHRGGFTANAELARTLTRIHDSDHLRLAGFMGYEAHLAKFPKIGGVRGRALDSARNAYEAALDLARATLPTGALDHLVINTAGSMTYPLHHDTMFANEMSVGTALLKGTDFDLDVLEDFIPACFIATPVLKVLDDVRLPGLDFLEPITSRLGRTELKTVFIHGGHWLAEPEYPPGLRQNTIFGRSSNQEMLNLPADTSIEPDDVVFLRPTQTEAVLMQFGDLLVYEDGEIIDTWSVLPASA